jgi:hypothetical protein
MRGKNKEFQTNELYCTLQYLHRGSTVYSSRFKPISNNKLHCKRNAQGDTWKISQFYYTSCNEFLAVRKQRIHKELRHLSTHTHHFEISEVLDLPFLNFLVWLFCVLDLIPLSTFPPLASRTRFEAIHAFRMEHGTTNRAPKRRIQVKREYDRIRTTRLTQETLK